MKKIALIAAMALVAVGCTKKTKHANVATAEAEAEEADARTDDEIARAERDIEEFGEDVQSEADRTLEEMERETAEARDDIENTAGRAEKMVTAEIVKLDMEARKVTFRLKDTKEEIELQAGKQIEVAFDDLQRLTGKTENEVVELFREGQDYEVEVTGIGDAMKIAKIELAQLEKKVREGAKETEKDVREEVKDADKKY